MSNIPLKEIEAVIAQIQETLKKSEPLMKKDDEAPPPPASEDPAPPPASEDPAPPPASEEPVAPPASEPTEGEPEGDTPQDGKPNEGAEPQEETQEIANELSSWSEEDIQGLLELLTKELASRQPAQSEVPPPAAPAAPPAAPPAPPAESPDMTGMKDDMQKMHSEVDEMKKSMAAIMKENESLKKSLKSPANKPAASNANVNVASKTPQAESPTPSKENLLLALETLHKSGNKAVDRDLIWSANHAKTPEDLKLVVELARLKGIKI